MATRDLQVCDRHMGGRGGGGGGALPDHCTCIPLVVPHRIEKLTELIADLRQPPIVEGSDVRHQPLAPDCTQMSEFNISLLDLRVSDYPFNICNFVLFTFAIV